MKRYEFLITLANGDQVHARSVGDNQKDALNRLLKQEAYVAFAKDTRVRHIQLVAEHEATPVNEDQFHLTPSMERQGWWVCADKKRNVVVRFQEHAYNETNIVTPLNDDYPTLDLATSLREIGEFLSTHYPELI